MIDEKNDPEGAIEIYEEAINDKAIARHPYDRLAILYRQRKQYDDEIRVLDKRLSVCNSMMIKGHTAWIEEYIRILNRKERVYELKNEKFVSPNLEYLIPANFSGCQNKFDRMKRVNALGLISVKGDIEFLIKVLNDSNEDSQVRRSVAFALGKKKDKRATNDLIKILENYDLEFVHQISPNIESNYLSDIDADCSLHIRTGVAMALGKIKDPKSVKPLIDALDDKNQYVVANSAYALGELKDKRAVEPLINIIKRQNPPKEAIVALGKIGDKRAVEPLINIIKRQNPPKEAVVALGKLNDKKAINPLKRLVKYNKTDYGSTINRIIRKLERIKD